VVGATTSRVAVARSGRSAEALAYYATTRRRLVEELGTEPGGHLRAAHRAVLCGQRLPLSA
jgi:hypothetical protein